ncbi:hypothetical protein ACFQH6_08645 [Halobacteriaceae archaeon GCM10025711]
MLLRDLLDSRHVRQLSAVSMLLEALQSLRRGRSRVALAFVGAAALAYRWSAVGFLAELLVRAYRRQRASPV